jgi:glycerophosphoryl diester phosphodiesterase
MPIQASTKETTVETFNLKHWPYPFWIAHRGAGKLAPENTLAAFNTGAQHGYRMFECDAKLSADAVVFLLHDDLLERTTAAQGLASEKEWVELAKLDAGRWHSAAFAGEPLPTLAQVAAFCIPNQHFLNIEIKPTAGLEFQTGEAVSRQAAQLWQDQAIPPLLSSFQTTSLKAALQFAPQLPRGLLLSKLHEEWLQSAKSLLCSAVICQYELWTADSVKAAHDAGLRCLSYTVNDPQAAQDLIELGTDGIITDRVDLFNPAATA